MARNWCSSFVDGLKLDGKEILGLRIVFNTDYSSRAEYCKLDGINMTKHTHLQIELD